MRGRQMGGVGRGNPADRFMRVNKSFIVSIAAVDSFDTNDLYIGDTPVAIGASYRDAVLGRLMR